MKRVRRLLIGLVSVLILAALLVYFNLNRIVRRTIETQATASLDLPTTLDGATLSLFGGHLALNNLQIASPQGYQAPHMLALNQGSVQVSYSQLRQDPIHIPAITLDQPRLVIEQANGKFNLQVLADLASKQPPDSQPIRLIIDQLTITNATVILRPGLPGLDSELTVPVPSVELKNIGRGEGAENGAALKDVALQVATALAAQSGQADLPAQLRAALKTNLQNITERLTADARRQLDQFTNQLDQILRDPKLGSQFDKLLGGKKNNGK